MVSVTKNPVYATKSCTGESKFNASRSNLCRICTAHTQSTLAKLTKLPIPIQTGNDGQAGELGSQRHGGCWYWRLDFGAYSHG